MRDIARHPVRGESHFRIMIVSPKFAGCQPSRTRHRMVNEAIADELKGLIHALALSTYAPGEE